ncbi:MAG: hypothetical protein U9P90_00140, partial [Patescibacteria group bacterium]|nr:hypothetical protein [Patescibacteria group bacterium]
EILEYSGVLPDRFRYTGPWKNLLVCDWLFQSEESNDTDDDIDDDIDEVWVTEESTRKCGKRCSTLRRRKNDGRRHRSKIGGHHGVPSDDRDLPSRRLVLTEVVVNGERFHLGR